VNERIKELAEQAGITTNLDTDYFEKDINKWVDYYSEKFAELIINECAACCGSQADMRNIRKRFGLPVESNVKYPSPDAIGHYSQYGREYNIPKE
jgi:hypothetical protein